MIHYKRQGLAKRVGLVAATLAGLVGAGCPKTDFDVKGHLRGHRATNVDQTHSPYSLTEVVLAEQPFYLQEGKNLGKNTLNIEFLPVKQTTRTIDHNGRLVGLEAEISYVPVNQIKPGKKGKKLTLDTKGKFGIRARIPKTNYEGTFVEVKEVDGNETKFDLKTITLEINGEKREFYVPILRDNKQLPFYLVPVDTTQIQIRPDGQMVLKATEVYRPIPKSEVPKQGPSPGKIITKEPEQKPTQ